MRGEMAHPFDETAIKTMKLANRFVRSATWEGLGTTDGFVTPALIDTMSRLAAGGIGLAITGHAYVSQEGQATPWQLGVYTDEQVAGLTELVDVVHDRGGMIAMQLAHAGARAARALSGLEPIGPSPAEYEPGKLCGEMTERDIRRVSAAFGKAAARAKRAGFDAVQIHGAHGYLVSQFFSPFFNKRTDQYGGSVENRARIAEDLIRAIRATVGSEFPVLIKINSEDFLPVGLTVEEMLAIALLLEKWGYDGVEMSGGTFFSGDRVPSRMMKRNTGKTEDVYYESAARLFKERVRIPLILVGGIRTAETAERLVGEGVADYIAMCRPFIREPALINRWRSGDRAPAACISDNGCFKPGFRGNGISCVVEARSERRTASRKAGSSGTRND